LKLFVVNALFSVFIEFKFIYSNICGSRWLDGQTVYVTRVREVWSSKPGPTKSYSALQTGRHRFNIYASMLRCLEVMTRKWAPQTRYTLRRNTASIINMFAFQ